MNNMTQQQQNSAASSNTINSSHQTLTAMHQNQQNMNLMNQQQNYTLQDMNQQQNYAMQVSPSATSFASPSNQNYLQPDISHDFNYGFTNPVASSKILTVPSPWIHTINSPFDTPFLSPYASPFLGFESSVGTPLVLDFESLLRDTSLEDLAQFVSTPMAEIDLMTRGSALGFPSQGNLNQGYNMQNQAMMQNSASTSFIQNNSMMNPNQSLQSSTNNLFNSEINKELLSPHHDMYGRNLSFASVSGSLNDYNGSNAGDFTGGSVDYGFGGVNGINMFGNGSAVFENNQSGSGSTTPSGMFTNGNVNGPSNTASGAFAAASMASPYSEMVFPNQMAISQENSFNPISIAQENTVGLDYNPMSIAQEEPVDFNQMSITELGDDHQFEHINLQPTQPSASKPPVKNVSGVAKVNKRKKSVPHITVTSESDDINGSVGQDGPAAPAGKFWKTVQSDTKILYQCPFATCNKTFTRPYNLKSHYRSHTGERPYQCECGMAFSRKYDLSRHEKLHTGVKEVVCEVCGKEFVRTDYLKRHLRNVGECVQWIKAHPLGSTSVE